LTIKTPTIPSSFSISGFPIEPEWTWGRGKSPYLIIRSFQPYGSLRIQGDQVVIRKERGRPKGRDHINGIEGFWSYAKNWLYPFCGVSVKETFSGGPEPNFKGPKGYSN
jgi:hypothetical protein